MGLSRLEQETIITLNAEENTAVLWTADPVWIRKMDKLVENNPAEFSQTKQETMDGVVVQKRYEFPKKLLSVRKGTRKMTEEQRKANKTNIAKMLSARKTSLNLGDSTTQQGSEDN